MKKEIICDVCKEKFFIEEYEIKFKDGRFIKRFPLTKYCSQKCSSLKNYEKHKDYYQHYWLNRPNLWKWKKPKNCEMCGKEYLPQKSISYTCSRKCCMKRNRLLHKESKRIYDTEWQRKDRQQNPEKYRFRTKQRRHMIRDVSGSSKKFSQAFTLEEWNQIKLEYNFTCPKCFKKEPEVKLTIDHAIPLSKGGMHSKENIQPLCIKCNSGKKDKTEFYSARNTV